MEYTGNLKKMEASHGEVIRYRLPVGEQRIDLNRLIGEEIWLEYQGRIHCIRCGRETKKSFAQGFCYPCFTTAPETEECVLRPELCRAHQGIARDMEYAGSHCLIDHVVYLSWTSGLKVGVTRHTQVPVRWIDQGAVRAIELARTPNRYTAGLLEVALKNHINDKTNWRKMLSQPDPPMIDLVREKRAMASLVPVGLLPYVTENDRVLDLEYPVSRYPAKVKSFNFDTDPLAGGVLTGIKGQYLMFGDQGVINVRKFGGYLVRMTTPG